MCEGCDWLCGGVLAWSCSHGYHHASNKRFCFGVCERLFSHKNEHAYNNHNANETRAANQRFVPHNFRLGSKNDTSCDACLMSQDTHTHSIPMCLDWSNSYQMLRYALSMFSDFLYYFFLKNFVCSLWSWKKRGPCFEILGSTTTVYF